MEQLVLFYIVLKVTGKLSGPAVANGDSSLMALIKSFSVRFAVEILFIPLSSISSLSVCTVGLLNTFT